jgi:hypothetical protein
MMFVPLAFELFRGEVANAFAEPIYIDRRRPGQASIAEASGQTASPARKSSMATVFLAAARDHADSVLALRIVFSICLAIVFFAGIYFLRNRKRFFDRDPEVTGDHYGARNLRLWQVILVWILAMDLLIMALWKV